MSTHNRFAKDAFTGGKGGPGVIQKIINLIPPHRVLIEPFAGEATLANTMRPPVEIVLVDKVRQPGLVVPRGATFTASFVQACGIAFLGCYKFKGHEFVYGDPPYMLAARSQRGRHYYENEMPDRDHGRWLRVAKAINCRVMISGYSSPLYERELAHWHRVEFEVVTRSGGKATEVLWMNYPPPIELHDYRFVGDDKRERHRLKKKIRRAVADLMSMRTLERGAMFAALSDAMKSPRDLATPDRAPQASAAAATETGV